MRENRTYGSEGGEAKAFPTPIAACRYNVSPRVREGRRLRPALVALRGACATEGGETVNRARVWKQGCAE